MQVEAQDPGSSPLTRGKPRDTRTTSYKDGLIPAHAGKTSAPARERGRPSAHPRSRGENEISLRSPSSRRGSSPLTRGKRQPTRRARRPKGLIPAHAGKTPVRTGRRRRGGAHPRSRGENMQAAMQLTRDNGSSPLTRGKLRASAPAVAGRRLIPAHAGKTAAWLDDLGVPGAHPRSRGENEATRRMRSWGLGSSPLTRGKPPGSLASTSRAWLIPAHAGKTTACSPASLTRRAHPRSRGENAALLGGCQAVRGSSPLTRGKHDGARHRRGAARLIPAHAGKT